MSPYFFIDIELINKKGSRGNTKIDKQYLELILSCLDSIGWNKRIFSWYHIGEYDSLSGNDLPNIKELEQFSDITTFAEGKRTVYLFSHILLKNHLFKLFETNRFVLKICASRITFSIPYWFIRNHETTIGSAKVDFHPIKEFEQFIKVLLQSINNNDNYLLRRANIRFLGLEYIKSRPPFDTFFLADNSLYEVYHNKEFSSGRKMPDYVARLSEYNDFCGINRSIKGDYVFVQWIESNYTNWDHHALDMKKILSKRHEWLSTNQEITKSNELNEYGEKQLTQKIPVKPPTPFVMNKHTLFLEPGISEENVYDKETRKQLKSKTEQLKANKQISKVHVIADNRNTAYLLLNEAVFELDYRLAPLRLASKVDKIYYRNEKSKVIDLFPVGKWKCNAQAPMIGLPASEIENSKSLSITKSENYITIRTFTTISCFKKSNKKYLPQWIITGGMDLGSDRINEQANRVEASDGFMGDLTPFAVELSTGKIIDYGEHEKLQSIKLYEIKTSFDLENFMANLKA